MTWQPPEPYTWPEDPSPFRWWDKDQLLAVRREAIESCARICDNGFNRALNGDELADAIRKLLETV